MLKAAMILLVVISVIGIASMNTAIVQTRATTNQNNKRTALLAAEAGASEALEAFKSGSGVWWSSLATTATPVSLSGSGVGNGRWRLESASGLSVDRLARQTIPIIGIATDSAGTELARVKLELQVVAVAGAPPGGFAKGLLGDRIGVSGVAKMQGSAHANTSFSVTASGNNSPQNSNTAGTISTAGAASSLDFTGRNVDTSRLQTGAASVDITVAVGRVETVYASVFANQTFSTCSIPAGDLGGYAYYCNNALNLSGNYSNGIIYSRQTIQTSGTLTGMRFVTLGDYVHQGAGNLGMPGTGNSVAVAAAGSVTVSGTGSPKDVHASLWGNGSITVNGSGQSTFYGGTVSVTGNVDFNGGLTYVQNDDYAQQGFGTPTTEVRMLGWREVE